MITDESQKSMNQNMNKLGRSDKGFLRMQSFGDMNADPNNQAKEISTRFKSGANGNTFGYGTLNITTEIDTNRMNSSVPSSQILQQNVQKSDDEC